MCEASDLNLKNIALWIYELLLLPQFSTFVLKKVETTDNKNIIT